MFSYIMLKTNYQPHALTFDYPFMEMQCSGQVILATVFVVVK